MLLYRPAQRLIWPLFRRRYQKCLHINGDIIFSLAHDADDSINRRSDFLIIRAHDRISRKWRLICRQNVNRYFVARGVKFKAPPL